MSLIVVVIVVLGLPFVIAVGGLVCAGGSFVIDAWRSRHPHEDMVERLTPLCASSLAEEARRWLDAQV